MTREIGPGQKGPPGATLQTDRYYVDGMLGNDSTGTGTLSAPFATIQAALNALGQPVSHIDAMRTTHIYVSGTLSAIAGGTPQTFDGCYSENLTVPSRRITIIGYGVKLGDNGNGSGGGNILKEYSASRRFGATSSELRPCLTLVGLANARDSHTRLRNSFHVGGTCRTAILKRNLDSIQGNGSTTVTIHVAPGQFAYPITIANYPTEPRIRITVTGTTSYNGTYDITAQVDAATFVATRISGTNAAVTTETAGAFFESDSAGASGLTHDASFINTYMQGAYTCDDGTVNSGAITAGTEVLYAVGSRFFTGVEGRAVLMQRCEDTTFAGAYIISSIAGMNNCSFTGAWTLMAAFTRSADDMGFMSCRWNAAAVWTLSAATTAWMDSESYQSFIRTGCTWATNQPQIDLLHRPVVAQANLTAQAATIGTTTLFTPPADGVYRVNVYASCTTAGSAGTATPTVGWKDDTTTQAAALSVVNLATLGSYIQQSFTVKCKAGQPITYAVAVAAAVGSPQFALYVNIEPVT